MVRHKTALVGRDDSAKRANIPRAAELAEPGFLALDAFKHPSAGVYFASVAPDDELHIKPAIRRRKHQIKREILRTGG